MKTTFTKFTKKNRPSFLNRLCLFLATVLLLLATNGFSQTVQTYTTSTTWVCPPGVTSVQVEAWGGGGGGGGAVISGNLYAGGGGAGGNYVKKTAISVTPGNTYTITVGAGGTAGTTNTATSDAGHGGTSAFLLSGTTLIAAGGGTGGKGGVVSNKGALGGVNGGVATITITSVGSGYSSAPTITITGGSGSGATAVASMSGVAPNQTINYIQLNSMGSGYTSAPTVTISGNATATASINASINLGYSTAFTGGNGANGVYVGAANAGNQSGGGGGSAGTGSNGNAGSGTAGGTAVTGGGSGGAGTATAATAGTAATTIGGGGGGGKGSTGAGSVGFRGQVTLTYTAAVTKYYYKGSGSLADRLNWGTSTNGTGSNPPDFITDLQEFYIRNTTAVSTDAIWTVSGSLSKIIVGDPTVAAVTLTIASGFGITGTVDIAAASSGSNSVLLKDATTFPTFGSLDAASEVHLQMAATITPSNITFGKLFVDGGVTTTLSGVANTPNFIQTSLTVASGSQLTLSGTSTLYTVINAGASVTINGYLKGSKQAGLFNYSVSTPGSTFGSLQFKDAVPSVTVGSSSTVEFSRNSVSSTQTISTLPSGVKYANLIITDGAINCPKSFAGAVTVSGTLTLNQSASTLTGVNNLTLDNGASIVRTAGTFDVAPAFGTTVNVTYNGVGLTSGPELPTSTTVLKDLTLSNAATLSADGTVNGILTLTSGALTMASGKVLTIGSAGSVQRSGGSFAAAAVYNTATNVTITGVTGNSGFELQPSSGGIGSLTVNGSSNYTLTSNASVTSLLIATNSTIANGGYNVTSSGNVSGGGTFSGIGKISMTGNGKTLGGTTISNLDATGTGTTTLSGSPTFTGLLNATQGTLSTSTFTLTLDASTGSAIFGPSAILNIASSGTAAFNSRSVILQSLSAGTAAIATIAGTLSGASNVTVERYIPSSGRRRYVMVTSPVTSTINAGWQEGQTGGTFTPVSGYGTSITGGVSQGTNGFDGPATSANGIFTYNDAASSNKWTALANTTDAASLTSGKGYLLFVRGDRSSNLATTPTVSTNTTLRATGTVGQGTVSPTLSVTGANKYNLIANPYPCAIDWNSGSITKTNLTSSFTVYDPNNGVFVSSNGTTKTPSIGNQQAGYIQSGQAFFVQNDATGNGAITFTEAAKTTSATTTSSTTVFGEDANKAQLNINVYHTADNSFADGAVALFGSNYQAAVDAKEDITKFTNLNETFGLRRSGIVLGLEARPLVKSTDTMYFSLSNFAKKSYSLVINGSNLNTTTAKLEDKFTGTSTAIDVAGSTTYNFNVTEDAATSSNDRFIITFGSTAASTVVTDGTAASSLYVKMSPNPVRHQLQVSFKTATAEATNINVVNSLGQVVKTVNAGKVATGNVSVPVAELATGVYTVQLISAGKVVSTQQVVKAEN